MRTRSRCTNGGVSTLHVFAPTTRESPQLNIRTSDVRLRYILRTEALNENMTLAQYITRLLWNALHDTGVAEKYREIFTNP